MRVRERSTRPYYLGPQAAKRQRHPQPTLEGRLWVPSLFWADTIGRQPESIRTDQGDRVS
jgi:hypothetical protein